VDPKNGGHGELGTAVLIPRDRLRDWKEISNHYLAIGSAKSGVPAVHYIGAGWTASGDFPTPQSWWAYLDSFADRLASPIQVAF
jgi:pectinesterase